jgi:type II secretory pathway component GspD/PulD (secretin)
MVSRATKRFWKSVALGLALSPAIGIPGLSRGQTPMPAPAVSPSSPVPPGAPGNDVEVVRQLVREGRAALQAGDKAKAEKLAKQAAAMRVTLPYWEKDTPEKLLLDVGVKTVPPPARTMPADPRTLLKQGQDALRAGRIDDAQKLAQQANAAPNFKWGLFDDTPAKLLDEVKKARDARDKAESAKAMIDARKLFEAGKYDDAEKLAYKASKLHGQYSMWDFSERPDKLLAEIQTAKEKARKAKLPPPPSTGATAVAAHKPDAAKPTTPAVKQASAQAPAPSWPADPTTPDIKTADVKGPDLGPGVTTAAGITMPGAPGNVMPVAAGPMPVPAPMAPAMPVAAVPMPAPMPTQTTVNVAKVQAQKCMADGKSLQMSGRLVEARAKYQEAQRCGGDFGPTEESPDRCLMDLSSIIVQKINVAMRETGPLAEAKLTEARQLAAGFGLDTYPIDAQLASYKAPPPPAPKPAVTDASVVGRSILDKARLELKRGQCEIARQLATEVHNGPYGLQADAAQVLATVDVEEHNQRVLAANRNFDAGMNAYQGKDFSQALAIFAQVDGNLLAEEKKPQLKQMTAACAKQDALAKAPPPPANSIMPVAAPGNAPGGVTTAISKSVTGLQGSKPNMTANVEGDSLASQVQAMQEIEYQRLRTEGLEVQSRAMQQFERGEADAALETLNAYMAKVKAAKLDATSIARLQRPIDAKINSFKIMRAAKLAEVNVNKSKTDFVEGKRKELDAEQKKQQQVKDLMKQFSGFYKEGKYAEAELAASKAHELDPDDPATEAAMQLASLHGGLTTYEEVRKRKENMFLNSMNQSEDPGPPVDSNNPLYVDSPRMKIANARTRDKDGITVMRNFSAKERDIQSKLMRPVQFSFHNVPLRQAVEDLQAMTGMTIHLEMQSLASEAVNPETPVSLKGDVSLKSGLKVLLDQVHLTYVVQDDMLKITTERAARGKLVQKVYSVADLVIPIDDYITPESSNINKAMDRIISQQGGHLGSGAAPTGTSRNQLQNGTPVGNATSGTPTMSTEGMGGATMRNGVGPGSTGSAMSFSTNVAPTKQSMQDMLIKLITNTVAPQSWAEVGGSGTIDYMPIGMALVINQTADVQEQVADLLEALRRLQDLEVSVEVRIITLAETFFERIGLDFALNVKTDKGTAQYEPQLVTGQFKPNGQVNDFSPRNFLAGITGIGNSANNVGSLTSDLDIPIRSSSFQYAIPPFAYPNNPGMNGGLSLGLAFLSDIQVYMFMEAAQGDRRTNVMQAPKLTLFNGQTSTINVNDQQFFVTNVNVVGFGGQIVFVPVNNPVPLGVQLAIQAVVSADRRFVRLNLSPTLSNLASATVPLFPVTTFITPVFEGGAQGQPIPFTQFIQQPQVSTVQIQTTVSIPDGGTVILGGLKTLSEGRNEFGPPVLSKLPYVNRLFKNVGYGREAQSLLLMVTPRIIINSEEEERQAGVSADRPNQP